MLLCTLHWSKPSNHCAKFWDPTKVMRPTLRETERASKVTKEETDEVKGPGGDISKMKLAGKAVYSNIKLFAFQAIATEGKLTGN